ncbi:F-box domain [Arabidopsis thaliana x Arabidopsis arenosa]|uniref:F-box domain n=1 Tax=Arabidopsis thaliana x Arabidopsis arenosa TaxID=1240361 RepID=A0A8T2ATU2_9BRAS|nr:F-box domain [Arabidopsis thaliana x Arabidopsis arenosa]
MRSEIVRETKFIFDLPQDVIEEIFSKVPVTSLRRLRSTCKRLYALLKDQGFIKKHFAKSARQYHALMLMNFRVYSVSSNIHGINMDVAPLFEGEFSLIDPFSTSEAIISQAFHCDGLLLCTTKENRLVVWNPFSGQTRWLQLQNRGRIDEAYVLGYDNRDVCHSYKILSFPDLYEQELETIKNAWKDLDVTPEGDLELKINDSSSNSWRRNLGVTPLGDLELKLYDFSSNSWKHLDLITPEGCLKSYGVSLKGNAYWVYVSNRRGVNDYSILSFDFSTERFQHLCVPFQQEADCFDTMALSVVREEHLSLLYQSCETLKMEIWMTKEIDTTFVSWRKFLTVNLEPHLPMFSCRMSFFIDEEKKVAVCCDRDNKVYIVGEDEYKVSPGFYFQDFEGITCCLTVFGYVPRLV